MNADFIFNYENDRPNGTGFKNATFDPTNPAIGQILGDTVPIPARRSRPPPTSREAVGWA